MLHPAPDCDEWKESHPHCVLHSEGGATDNCEGHKGGSQQSTIA